MDGNEFDNMTRRLGKGHSRRAVLRGLFGGSAALQELNPAGPCSGPVCKNGTDAWPGHSICYNPTFTVALG